MKFLSIFRPLLAVMVLFAVEAQGAQADLAPVEWADPAPSIATAPHAYVQALPDGSGYQLLIPSTVAGKKEVGAGWGFTWQTQCFKVIWWKICLPVPVRAQPVIVDAKLEVAETKALRDYLGQKPVALAALTPWNPGVTMPKDFLFTRLSPSVLERGLNSWVSIRISTDQKILYNGLPLGAPAADTVLDLAKAQQLSGVKLTQAALKVGSTVLKSGVLAADPCQSEASEARMVRMDELFLALSGWDHLLQGQAGDLTSLGATTAELALQTVVDTQRAIVIMPEGKGRALRWSTKVGVTDGFTASVAPEGSTGRALCAAPSQEATFSLVFPTPIPQRVVEVAGVSLPQYRSDITDENSGSMSQLDVPNPVYSRDYEQLRGLCLAKGNGWDVMVLDEAFDIDPRKIQSGAYWSIDDTAQPRAGVVNNLKNNQFSRWGWSIAFLYNGAWQASQLSANTWRSADNGILIYMGSGSTNGFAVACMRKSNGEDDAFESEKPISKPIVEVRTISLGSDLRTQQQFDSAVDTCRRIGKGWDILKFDAAFETKELFVDPARKSRGYISWIFADLKLGISDGGVMTWGNSLMKGPNGEYALRSITHGYQFTDLDGNYANDISCMKEE